MTTCAQPFFGAFRWSLLPVCPDPPPDARVYLQSTTSRCPALKSGANVTALMSAAGNRRGGLPFTLVLREGLVCQTHEGGLTAADLKALRLACSTSEAQP